MTHRHHVRLWGRTKVVSNFNAEFGHRPTDKWAEMILARLETKGVDVLAVEEAQDYFLDLKRLAEDRGHTLVGHGLNSRNALLVRKGLTVGPVGSVPGDVATWKTPHGTPQSMAEPVVALVGRITYVAIHAPVHAWVVAQGGRRLAGPAARVQAYKDFTTNLVEFVNATPGRVVVLGDWNATPDTLGDYSPAWVAAKTGMDFIRPLASTGHGEIDFGLAKPVKVTSVEVVPKDEFLVKHETGGSEGGQHSDHLQVIAQVRFRLFGR